MNKKSKTLLLALAVTSLSACVTQQDQMRRSEEYKSTMITNVPLFFHGMMISPTLCDYKTLTDTSVSYVFNTDLSVTDFSSDADIMAWESRLVVEAESKLIAKYNADAVIALSQQTSTSKEGKLVVEVKGIPVRYVNFRPATEKDLWMMNVYGNLNKANAVINMGAAHRETEVNETNK